jgi:hypothetical protein
VEAIWIEIAQLKKGFYNMYMLLREIRQAYKFFIGNVESKISLGVWT